MRLSLIFIASIPILTHFWPRRMPDYATLTRLEHGTTGESIGIVFERVLLLIPNAIQSALALVRLTLQIHSQCWVWWL